MRQIWKAEISNFIPIKRGKVAINQTLKDKVLKVFVAILKR